MFTYTNGEKSYSFSKEQIKSLQNIYSEADSIADSVDSVVNLDSNFLGAVRAIFFHLYTTPANYDLFTYDEEEPFIDWFNNIKL